MNLHQHNDIGLLHLQSVTTLTPSEHAIVSCRVARRHEEAGDYEAARQALNPWWRRVGERPSLDGLNERAAAEVVMRAGTLSGWLGSAKQLTDAQESAKDLLSEGIRRFEALRLGGKIAEARTELAYCYWREGAFAEARVLLEGVLTQIGDAHSELRARAVLRLSIVEFSANHLHEALCLLNCAATLFEIIGNDTVKGGFHNQLALTLRNIGTTEKRADYIDRALIEYAAASFHFEQAGHERYRAYVENNVAFLYVTLGRFSEAHEHLDHARRLFDRLKDSGNVAQADETRARTLIAEDRFAEAERFARSSVQTLEQGGEQALLAQALTTHGIALARLHRRNESQTAFDRAIEVAELMGNHEAAGRAALSVIEEIGDHLSAHALRRYYDRADRLLVDTQDAETRERLMTVARRVIARQDGEAHEQMMHALATFSAGIAHSINNPLCGIMGRAQLLQNTNDAAKLRQGLEKIVEATQSGATIVRRLQSFARGHGNAPSTFVEIDRLLFAIGETTRHDILTKHAAHVHLSININTTASVCGAEAELREALLNFIENAVEAMPEGGTLTLAAEQVGANVQIVIADTGEGMDEAITRHIFTPFFTTKGVPHSGMGLAISYRIIEQHGGTITVESEQGSGTRFRINLPVAQTSP